MKVSSYVVSLLNTSLTCCIRSRSRLENGIHADHIRGTLASLDHTTLQFPLGSAGPRPQRAEDGQRDSFINRSLGIISGVSTRIGIWTSSRQRRNPNVGVREFVWRYCVLPPLRTFHFLIFLWRTSHVVVDMIRACLFECAQVWRWVLGRRMATRPESHAMHLITGVVHGFMIGFMFGFYYLLIHVVSI
jgi:hypothetical protein